MNLAHTQLSNALNKSLVNLVDVADIDPKVLALPTSSVRLTRALAAAAVQTLALVDERIAAQTVTDGQDDRGIDAVYVDAANNTLLLVQSKWSRDGRGTISKGDILKFVDGFREMMDQDWSAFNGRIRAHQPQIDQVLMDPSVRIIMCVVTSADADLSGDALKVVNKFLQEINTPGLPAMVSFEHLKLSDVLLALTSGGKISLDATLENWGPIGEPYAAQYGVINAADLSDWYEKFGERLFESNIRQALGRTQANQAILTTLIGSPEEFWYLNNGVTVLATSITKAAKGAASRTQGSFRLDGASVVNGAQTVSTIHAAKLEAPEAVGRAKVAIRFISLEGCPDDFATRVTRATNTQNSVESRDFVALDPLQARLRTEFLVHLGKVYAVRRGETPPPAGSGCTVVEAAIALACRLGPAMAVQAKATIGRIWESVGRPPYSDLFNDSTTANEVWRCVEVMRVVDDTLERMRRNSSGRRAAFAVQGNRLVLSMVFSLLPEDATGLKESTWQTLLAALPQLTERSFKRMVAVLDSDFADNYVAALSKNTTRSRSLYEKARKGAKRLDI